LANSLADGGFAAQVVHSPKQRPDRAPEHGKYFYVTVLLQLDFHFFKIFQIVDKIAEFLGNPFANPEKSRAAQAGSEFPTDFSTISVDRSCGLSDSD
jgi:hypothetical protein